MTRCDAPLRWQTNQKGELPKVFHLISVLTRIRVASTPLSSIPFKQGNKCMELITDDALEARRAVARSLTEDAIRALRAKPNPREPNFTLMQTLYESGIRQCPLSGSPVFDPSKLEEGEKSVLWGAYCGVAESIDDAKHVPATVEKLERLRAMIEARGPGDQASS